MAVSVSAISAKDNESISSDEEDVSLTETDRGIWKFQKMKIIITFQIPAGHQLEYLQPDNDLSHQRPIKSYFSHLIEFCV